MMIQNRNSFWMYSKVLAMWYFKVLIMYNVLMESHAGRESDESIHHKSGYVLVETYNSNATMFDTSVQYDTKDTPSGNDTMFNKSTETESYVGHITKWMPGLETTPVGNVTESNDEEFIEDQVAINLYRIVGPLIIGIGTFGNILSIATLCQRHMRNSTSCLYLIAVAVADILVLWTGLMYRVILNTSNFDIAKTSDMACKLRMFTLYFCPMLSTWYLVAVTADRTICVLFPLRSKRLSTRRKALLVVLAIFLIMLSLNLHFFWTYTRLTEGCVCDTADIQSKVFIELIWPWLDLVVTVGIPFVTLITCNTLIIFKVVRNSRFRKSHMNVKRTKDNTNSMTIMLLTASFSFLILTTPIQVFFIGLPHWSQTSFVTSHGKAVKRLLLATLSLLFWCNNAINFVLYCVSGRRFRREFFAIFKCRRGYLASSYNSSTKGSNNNNGALGTVSAGTVTTSVASRGSSLMRRGSNTSVVNNTAL